MCVYICLCDKVCGSDSDFAHSNAEIGVTAPLSANEMDPHILHMLA